MNWSVIKNRIVIPFVSWVWQLVTRTIRAIVQFLYEVYRDQLMMPVRSWLKRNFWIIVALVTAVTLANVNPDALVALFTALLPFLFIFVGFRILFRMSPLPKLGKKKKR